MSKDHDDIIKNYKKKVDLLDKHNKSYYQKDSPQISDAEYDKLKIKILDLEKKKQIFKKIWYCSKYCWL